MQRKTIQEQFRAAAKYFEEVYKKNHGRGFQARVAESSGVRASYFNEILKGKKDGPEEVRRKLVGGIVRVCEQAKGFTYEIFLDLGEHIITTGSSNGWQDPSSDKPTAPLGNTLTYPIVDKNMQLITEWINLQDEPGDYWIFLKLLLDRESPEFHTWLKKRTREAHQGGFSDERSVA